MSFEIGNGQYYSRVFFTEVKAGRRGDMMGAIYTVPGSCEWLFRYRCRWYNDDLLDHTSTDERNWYDAKGGTKPLSELLDSVRLLFATASGVAGDGTYSELVIETAEPEKIYEIFRAQPWIHMTEMAARK